MLDALLVKLTVSLTQKQSNRTQAHPCEANMSVCAAIFSCNSTKMSPQSKLIIHKLSWPSLTYMTAEFNWMHSVREHSFYTCTFIDVGEGQAVEAIKLKTET